jgi:ribosomal protein S12 methylthiotransferase accessory factor
MWMNRLTMPRLRVADDPELASQLAGVLAGRDARVTFVNLTNDYRVPVVLAVLESRLDGRQLVTVGSSAKRTFREAILKAFAEAVSDLERLRHTLAGSGPRWKPEPDFSNVTDFEWHSLVYTHPEYQPHLEFLTASPIEQAIPHEMERGGSPTDLLVDILSEFERHGHDVLAVDLTTREVADLGVSVVKIVAPEAVPLNPDHRFPPLGHRRLYEVPRRLGYRTSDSTVADLNPMPHPFA